MKKFLIICFILLWGFASGQVPDTLTLGFCHNAALTNYPLAKQYNLLEQSAVLKQKNVSANYLPQVALNGQATYQSDVVELPIEIEDINIPSLPKDMYSATLNVSQLIYDGSLTGKQHKLETVSFDIEKTTVDKALYELKERITEVYFAISYGQIQISILESHKIRLLARKKQVESAVANGVLLSSELDRLKAEEIKLLQQLLELQSGLEALFFTLSELTGVEIPSGKQLRLPEQQFTTGNGEQRNEFLLLSLQQQRLSTLSELSAAKRNPKLAGFGTYGYGRPGLNILSDKFNDYYIIGIKLTWDIWDWNVTKNEKAMLSLRGEMLESQKEAFLKNVRATSEKYLVEISRYETLIEMDDEIIKLQEQITSVAASQLENGTITVSDYINELNAETQARLSRELHKIQKAKAIASYLAGIGKL